MIVNTTIFLNDVSGQVPWNRSNYTGQFMSFDGTPTTDFGPDDIAKVLAAASVDHGGGWDGEAAAVIQLRDGRWVAWESSWGPTGDGFNCDAYGGDANVYFGASADAVIRFGLTNSGRELLMIDDLSDPTSLSRNGSQGIE